MKLVALALLTIATPAPRRVADWTVGPRPAWVEPVAAPASASSADLSGHDVEYLLYERQIRRAAELSRYMHQVIRVLTPSGVEDESQIEIDFEPYQKLVVHEVRIIRKGMAHDALRTARHETLRKEQNLERLVFTGTLTAVIILDDVRVGDVIDYSFTLEGENPIFGGKWAGELDLAFGVPVRRLRHRVVEPAGRPLQARPRGIQIEPRMVERGAEREWIWERRDVAGIDHEEDAPPWHERHPWVQVTEWGSWREVRQWAAGLYDRSVSPELAGQIDQWKNLPKPEDRLIAALRFVQDDVRYLGIELGPNSHRPHVPAEVFQRRFGDCKDKAGLLVAILARLGIDAHPALVNTDLRKATEGFLPSPLAFDHVIVRASIGGHVFWLDATDSLQRGALAEMATPPEERALVLDNSGGGLDVIPRFAPSKPLIAQTDTYTVRDYSSPVELEVVTDWVGPRADHMRHVLASKTREEMLKEYQNFYAGELPQIQTTGPLEVKDDQTNNVVRLVERYRIPAFWSDTRHDFGFDLLADNVLIPRTRLRSTPLWLHHPIDEVHVIRVKLPSGWHIKREHRVVEDRFMRLDVENGMDGNNLEMRRHLQTLADEVPAADVAKHLDLRSEMRSELGYWIDHSAVVADQGLSTGAIVVMIGFGCVVAGAIVVPRVRKVARRRRLAKRVRHDLGETAATALSIRDEAELARLRCPCGGSLADSGERDQIAFGDRQLSVARLRCTQCEQRRSLYFTLMSR